MIALGHHVELGPPTRVGLPALELVIALNAVGGAIYGLSGAPDVPPEWLEGTPFNSYVIPSVILLVAVGGGMTAAAAAVLLRLRRAAEASIAAGLTLVVWITAQVLIIVPDGGFSWLQPAMFVAGLLVAGLGWRLRRRMLPQVNGASRVDAR
jgi:hypothetical protein